MATNVLIQTHIDADVKQRASDVLESVGLTVSDAVRILLTRTADEGALPFALSSDAAQDAAEYDLWFRRSIQEALDSSMPTLSSEEVEAYFAKRRADSIAKAEARGE